MNVALEIESVFKKYLSHRPYFMELISISTGNRFNVFIDIVKNRKENLETEYTSFREIKGRHLNEIVKAKAKVVEESEAASEKLKQTIIDQDAITKSKLASKYGEFYQEKANEFRKTSAKYSLWISIILGVLIIIVSFSIPLLKLKNFEIVDGLGGLYPFLATKLTVLAVLFIFFKSSNKELQDRKT